MKFDPPIVNIELKRNGKVWVEVRFENGIVWRPRLWEVGSIISGIGKAEDIKYPDGKGYMLTQEFLNRCFGKTREEIYELALSPEFDKNGVMQKRYRAKKCGGCGRYFDGNGDDCDLCTTANKAWES